MADIETVISKVERVVFNRGEFYIFYTEDGFSVKGNSGEDITPGVKYEITGVWGEYNGIPQMTASKIEAVKDDEFKETLIGDFLAYYVPKIGEKTALALACKFGEDVLDVLEEGDSETVKVSRVLTKKKLADISKFVKENREVLDEKLSFRLLGLTFGVVDKIVDVYGIKRNQVEQNPFVLMSIEGVGFDICEHIFEQFQLNEYSVDRFAGAIEYSLYDLHINNGDAYFSYTDVNNAVFKLLFDRKECRNEDYLSAFFGAVQLLTDNKKIVSYSFVNNKVTPVPINSEGARIALARYTKMEIDIKKQIYGFLNARKVSFDSAKANLKIDALAATRNIELDEKQREALLMCMQEPISIVYGGPGTGKTTIMGLLAAHFRKEGIKCAFCAPTGRAAKRLSEAIEDKAFTIHRILGYTRSDDETGDVFCAKNSLDPIDARVIVVDEMSMVDMEIFLHLLEAIDRGASLILIGDPNQLPSVGPGNVLKNLIEYNPIPKVELTYIFRQSGESLIASNAYRILDKEKLTDDENEFIIKNFDDEKLAEEYIRDIYLNVYMNNEDAVILTPTKQNNLGTMRLNEVLQKTVVDKNDGFRARSSLILHVGDRVMQIKNDYQIEYEQEDSETGLGRGVYNGELGEVCNIDEEEELVLIKFDDGKIVPYSRPQLENVELAYAMTVHKAQGCEFDTVILVLGRFNYLLSNWRILYTAVTRAKKKIVVVNFGDRINKMILSSRGYERHTSLLDFLQSANGSASRNGE
ncbi:MAG: AAA family ATPase [Clostridia bacterium]|nr:AAA family ATPase [Clostridia bacterium]